MKLSIVYILIAASLVLTTSCTSNGVQVTGKDSITLTVPAGLTATVQNSADIALSWQSSQGMGTSGVGGYYVLRDGTRIGQTAASTTTYTDIGLAAGTTYTYNVQAFDNSGNVSASSAAAMATTLDATDTTPPTVPQNLTAKPSSPTGATSIDLAWQSSTDTGGSALAGYGVKRDGAEIARVSATTVTMTDVGLAANTQYAYTVSAIDGAGNASADSNVATATTGQSSDTVPPTMPQSVAASATSSTSILISWAASTDAGGSGLGGYRIMRGGVQVAQVPSTALNYTDSGLKPSTQYSYTVTAFDRAGNVSSASAAAAATTPGDTTAPTSPLNLAAAAQSSTSIRLTWAASTDSGGSGLAGYRLFRSGTQIAQLGNGTLVYTDTGLQPGSQYSYTVRAYDNAGNVSAPSNTATASTSADSTAPTVPQGVSATAQSTASISVQWSASTDLGGSGLAGYRVFRGGSQVAQVAAGTTTYLDSGLNPSTQYSYTVRAYDNAGNVSADSTAASATTQGLTTGMSARPGNTSCVARARPGSGGSVTLSVVQNLPNLRLPQFLTSAVMAKNDSSRWYIVAQDGHIYWASNAQSTTTLNTFVDLTDRVAFTLGTEMGLFNVAFHPNWPSDPRAYVIYTTKVNGPLQSHVAEIRSTDGGNTLDRSTEKVLLTVNQPEENHNGGFLAFSPVDGFLYVGFGDGGGANDGGTGTLHGPFGNAQNTMTLLGKILRIDVNNANGSVPYSIPSSNPYRGNASCNVNGTGSGNCPEIYAYGMRNPWRGSFDRRSGQLWIGDVGQDAWEEIDKVNVGGNYGWRCREGANPTTNACATTSGFTDPVAQYNHSLGKAVIGGYVYNGSKYPALANNYIFGDLYGNLFRIPASASPTLTMQSSDATPSSLNLVAFAEDTAGELYLLDLNGGSSAFWQLQASGGGTNTIPDNLSATGCVSASNATLPASGIIPYAPNAQFWSDGATKQRWLALPDGYQISTNSLSNGDWGFPNGTVLVKSFSLNNQLVETRLFMHHTDGTWAGYTYEWNAAQTDATRVVGGKDKAVSGQTWHFPSETECMQCHSSAAGYSLGIETAQLNGDFAYPAPPPPYTGLTANQVYTLNHIGLLSPAISGDPATLPSYPNPAGTAGTIAERARAYLHTNCSQCHRPGGGTPVNLDLRYQTSASMSATNTCGTTPQQGNLGLSNPKIIDPGNAANSVLYLRMSRRGTDQMPPIATNLVDVWGAALLQQWITQMSASCQ